MNQAHAVLLYDGECGFCARSVQFVLKHELPAHRALVQFAPLQSEFGAYVRARHPETANVDSIVWFETLSNGRSQARVRSAAALAVGQHLGGGWRWFAAVGRLVPRPIRDALYDVIARKRSQLAPQACVLPTASQRHRFIV